MESPIGKLTIEADGEWITAIYFQGEQPSTVGEKKTAVLLKCSAQLQEYFDGKRQVFDIPLRPRGSEFFRQVWAKMASVVPFGTTVSYSELAALAGRPKAARAVGMANRNNPIPILIPCHRVVGKNGKLTGFRGGLDIKEKLLLLEKQVK